MGLAKAQLINASLLPNPSLGLGFAALIYGPPGVGASTPSYAASLSQDITSLITYHARVAAARAELRSVNARLLWDEWQVAQDARLLATQIYYANIQIRDRAREFKLLSDELVAVREAAASGSLDLTAEAPLAAARAGASVALAMAKIAQIKNWQKLDALMGLVPSVRFEIRKPVIPALPASAGALLATLPSRRPDLVALQLGYAAQENRVRAAILGQFPALSLGPAGGTDTSNILSIGPTLTMDLPIFNQNQGGIAAARATREVLHAQYQAQLDKAAGMVKGLSARIAVLGKDIRSALAEAKTARLEAKDAEEAYDQGNLDQRSLVDYQTTALARELELIALRTSFDSDRLALAIELGIGLPQTRIVPQPKVTKS
jgi:outer membrane protein TolC